MNPDKLASDTIVQKEAGDPSVETQWQVMTSNAALFGDVLFFKGAFGDAFDVSVGASYEDRGIRKDQHDFFGVALSIPMSDKNPRGQKRQQDSASGVTQPASKELRQVHDATKNSSSGAAQLAAAVPGSSAEKRVTENETQTPRSSTNEAAQPAASVPEG